MVKREQAISIIGLIMLIIIFVLVSYLVQRHIDAVSYLLNFGYSGMLFYVFLTIFATVFAPVSAFPLIPVASALWGWPITGFLNLIGWVLGSYIAFLIARKYGVPIVRKLVKMEKVRKFENLIPRKNIFWGIVFLRIVIPTDILSYALGIFSTVSKTKYLLATVIGIIPGAFLFAYIGTIDFYYQLIIFTISVSLFFIWLAIVFYRQKAEDHKKN